MTAHVTSPRTYVFVFVALIALTALTVTAAQIDLGWMNAVVALAIATLKAFLVVTFFMGLRFSSFVSRVWLLAAVAFVLLLLGGSLDDLFTRHTATYLPYEQMDGAVPGIGLDGLPTRPAH
ncbi:MAG TPA: cytochrome C oxidase subunit IV family protein [Candidatus Binatia bacterium]|nr:cytochrome C oxidase subunit IV family protein [Candidatus Binatia bacterium]